MEENETKTIEIPSGTPCSSENEDCFILDINPFESISDHVSKLSPSNNLHHDDDDNDEDDDNLQVISEKGQVACRDYPHSRHLCVKYPFYKTPHENHCEMCYCYVCDSTAPCKFWTEPESPDDDDDDQQAHCHASEHIGDWKSKRNLKKLIVLI